MQLHATVDLHGKTATGIRVPETIVEELGHGKRVAVRVTINGYTYLSTIAPRGGEYLLPVSADARAHAGVHTGDAVDVTVELDSAPRTVELPADLAASLAADPDAQRAFAALSYSNQRQLVLPIADAKTSETRQRRIAKMLSTLQTGK